MILEIIWAVVNVSTGFVRNAPDYESGLETQLMMGTVVQIDSTQSYWRHVHALEPEYTGWINDLQLAPIDDPEAYIARPKYICTAEITRVYAAPADTAARLCEVVMGNILTRGRDLRRGWSEVLLPDGRSGWMKSGDIEDFSRWAATRVRTADSIEALSRRFLGVPYQWGGTSIKGEDCSGFVRTVYLMHGILLPRNASQQVRLGDELPLDMKQWRKGDLLFFGTPATSKRPMRVTHVAMYLGEGRIIHSSQLVRINSLVEGEPDFYDRKPVAARRMLGREGTPGGPALIQDSRWYFKQ